MRLKGSITEIKSNSCGGVDVVVHLKPPFPPGSQPWGKEDTETSIEKEREEWAEFLETQGEINGLTLGYCKLERLVWKLEEQT